MRRTISFILIFLLSCLSLPAQNGGSGGGTGAVGGGANTGGGTDGPLPACEQLAIFSAQPSTTQITLHAASDRGPLRNLAGFLNGISIAVNNNAQFGASVAALKPKYWRVGNGVATIYEKLRAYNPTLTLVLSDAYTDSFPTARPWDNWLQYDDWLKSEMADLQKKQIPVTYWDVWGEPQGGTPFRGTYAQLLELFRRTYTVIKSVLPEAKVIGPSFDDFEGTFAGMTAGQLILDLDSQFHIRLDGLAWHELSYQNSDKIVNHVNSLRSFLSDKFPGYTPELHVNEYANSADHHLPGHTFGYFQALQEAGVDVTARACWPQVPPSGTQWSDCWAGLNGLLMQDNVTPQSVFWLYRYYADLAGNTWLQQETTDPRSVVIAARSPGGTVSMLIGRFSSVPPGPAIPLTVKVTDVSWQKVEVTVATIPATAPSTAVPQPTQLRCIATPNASILQLTTTSMADGSAQWLSLREAQ